MPSLLQEKKSEGTCTFSCRMRLLELMTKSTKLCASLQHVLGTDVKCSNASDSFSKPPILSERFSSSSTYQFYHGPRDIDHVSRFLEQVACGGSSSLQSLCDVAKASSNAAYLDFDFDVISHALTITGVWSSSHGDAAVLSKAPAKKASAGDRFEIGILQAEKPDEPEELSLGGFLTVLGDDDKPSKYSPGLNSLANRDGSHEVGPTMFSFPARHHPLPEGDDTTYRVASQEPTGLHPKLDITLPSQSLKPPKDSCALHAYWTLPSSLFIDRYQLSDQLFLESQNLKSLHALSGEQDLEAPDWAVNRWGSAALIELADPPSDGASNFTATIPTHLRYVNGTSTVDGKAMIEIPWPIIFWACEAEEGLKMSTNPFDRVNLGYDGLFGPKTMFYHVPPAPGAEILVETLPVPILDSQSAEWVPMGTAIAVLLGFGWICWQMLKGGNSSTERIHVKKTN